MKLNSRSERGQALVIIMLAMVALIGLAGLSIDGGNAYTDRRHAQNAADTAVLAAALDKVNGSANWQTTGELRANSNGYYNAGENSVYVYQCTDANGTTQPDCNLQPTEDPTEYVAVAIDSHVKTYFAKIVGWQEFENKVKAVAHAIPSTTQPMFGGSAVAGVAPHECQAVKYQGNAGTTITGGGIYVNSDCSGDAFKSQSGAANLTAPSLCSVGGITPNSLNIGTETSPCAQMPMPLEPNPECSGSGSRSGDTLSAGTFSGQFPPSGVKFLNAGIYCVSGDFRLNGGDSLTSLGSGVVIRMDSGNVVWNGGAVINLYAPTTGPFKGLLLFMPCNNPDQNISLNGSSSSTIKGSIVGMCADASWEGNNGTVLNGQLVGYTVTINGTSNNTITYDNQYNFDATYPPQIELNK